MSGVVTEPADVSAPRRSYRGAARIGAFVAFGLGLGAAAGVLWELVVDLPVYKIASDGAASTTERGLTEFFGGDAWFAAIGLLVGLGLGILGWRRFRDLGWPLVLVVVPHRPRVRACCAGWWATGSDPGTSPRGWPRPRPGDLVPIELTLRARAALLTWPFFAVIPILLGSSLGRDDEDPQPLFRRSTPTSGGRQPED